MSARVGLGARTRTRTRTRVGSWGLTPGAKGGSRASRVRVLVFSANDDVSVSVCLCVRG